MYKPTWFRIYPKSYCHGESTTLLGCWEEVLAREMQTVEGMHSMFDVELWTKQRRR